jgi:small-conductance mechanosensitive channel
MQEAGMLESVFGASLAGRLGRAETALRDIGAEVLQPFVLLQIATILAVLLLSVGLGTRVEKALEPRVRAIHGQPRLLRVLALILRRMRWVVAAVLMGGAALLIRVLDEPSHAALVGVAFALIAAWVAISIVSRLIRNRALARLVGWAAWIYVALRITSLFDEVAQGLDAVAVQLGAVRLSAYLVLQAVVVICALVWLASALGNFIERRVAANPDLTPSLKVLIGKLVKIGLVVIACALALSALGIDLTALTVFSGALGVGIGFGLQKVVSNFVSGIIILLDKSIKPGDTIALGDTFGWIKALRARFVTVATRDGRSFLIPNEDFITERVVNWSLTETLVRFDVEFGVSYESDPHAVRRVAVEAASGVQRVQERPQPVCHIIKFNDSSIDFILRFWIVDPQNGVTNVKGAVLLAVWDAFKAAGIEFPAPQREIILRKPVEVRSEIVSRADADRGPRPVD